MTLSNSKTDLTRVNQIIGIDGLIHQIVVQSYVRDDESVYYQAVCLCHDYHSASYDTKDEAKEASETHMSQVRPAPREATYTSIIRGALGSRR